MGSIPSRPLVSLFYPFKKGVSSRHVKSTGLSIGSDPELCLLDKNEKIIRAKDVIHQEHDKFGVDGHSFIAELRPNPAIHPRDLISSIREVLGSRASQLQQLIWRAGPWVCDKPLGGHIHFGVPKEDHIVDALNHQFAILLALIEPDKAAATRRTTIFYGDKPYGQLGDVRSKNWGFEYRTPSSFIVTPGATLGLLTAAKAIVWEEIQGGSQAFSKLPRTTREDLAFTDDDFHHCKRSVFLPKIEALKNQLAKMLYFGKGQEGNDLWSAITYLLKQVVEKGGYNPNEDLKAKWKLINENTKKFSQPPTLWQSLAQPGGWWHQNPQPPPDNLFVIPTANLQNFTFNQNPQPQQNTFTVPTLTDPGAIWEGLEE